MTKKENIENTNSCWNKAADDEIMFILRSKDPEMPATIRAWVNLRINHGLNVKSDGKILGALRIAAQVDDLHKGKGPPSILIDGHLPPNHPSEGKVRITVGDRVTALNATEEGGRVVGFYTRGTTSAPPRYLVAIFWGDSDSGSDSGLQGLRFHGAHSLFFRPYNCTTPWWVNNNGEDSKEAFGDSFKTVTE